MLQTAWELQGIKIRVNMATIEGANFVGLQLEQIWNTRVQKSRQTHKCKLAGRPQRTAPFSDYTEERPYKLLVQTTWFFNRNSEIQKSIWLSNQKSITSWSSIAFKMESWAWVDVGMGGCGHGLDITWFSSKWLILHSTKPSPLLHVLDQQKDQSLLS